MIPEDYEKAAEFFSKLNEAVSRLPFREEDIEKAIEESYSGNPHSAVYILGYAVKGIAKYSREDLRYLANAGFDICESIFTCDLNKESENVIVEAFGKQLINRKELTEKFWENNRNNIEDFNRILRAYADISLYEAKVLDTKKTEALKRVLKNR